jgi:hypothetical protein
VLRINDRDTAATKERIFESNGEVSEAIADDKASKD